MSRLAVGAIGLLFSIFAATIAAHADDWHLYTAPDHTFSVRFPTAPEVEMDGNAPRASASPSKHETYIVEYTPLPRPMEDQYVRLFTAGTKAFTDSGATVLGIYPTTVAGHPAQDAKIRSKEGYVAWDRFVAVNDRVYQLLYISDHKTARPDRFWASFVLQP